MTALHKADSKGSSDIVTLLLTIGADMNLQDNVSFLNTCTSYITAILLRKILRLRDQNAFGFYFQVRITRYIVVKHVLTIMFFSNI